MPANTTPIFTAVPIIGVVAIATANTNLDGTGTIATLVTGSTNGTKIDRITITATVTTTAGMIRFFIDPNTGTNYMFAEATVAAVTPSASVPAFTKTLVFDRGLVLPADYLLRVSTEKATNFNIVAYGGTY